MARKEKRHLKGLVLSRVRAKDDKGRQLYDVRLSPGPGKPRDYFAVALPEAQARRFYENRKEDLKQGKYFPYDYQARNQESLAAILDDYLKTTIAKRARNGEQMYGRWWKGFFQDLKPGSLTPALIEKARSELSQGRFVAYRSRRPNSTARVRTLTRQAGRIRPCSPATINRYTDWLRHVCNWAIKQRRLRDNPVKAIDRYQETGKQIYFLTPMQENNLCEQLTDEELDAVRLGILTGMRRGEQFRINKTTDLDLSVGLILLAHDKQGRADPLPLGEEAFAIVQRQVARHPESVWLYPGLQNRGPMNANWFYEKRFKPAWQRAGLPIVPGRKLWHSLRHTFGTRLALEGANEHTIKALGRWTSSKAAQRYIHLTNPALRETLNRLAAHGSQKTATEMAANPHDPWWPGS